VRSARDPQSYHLSPRLDPRPPEDSTGCWQTISRAAAPWQAISRPSLNFISCFRETSYLRPNYFASEGFNPFCRQSFGIISRFISLLPLLIVAMAPSGDLVGSLAAFCLSRRRRTFSYLSGPAASASLTKLRLRPTPRSADRTRSLVVVSKKREYFLYGPETFGDFAPKLFNLGV
jgi:hypothetical protein